MLTLEYLAELHRQHPEAARAQVKEFSIGGRHFAFNSAPAVMGVINLSPDSWYRESVCLTTEHALQRAEVLCAQGAGLIDVGAESTLNHAARVDETAQVRLMLPVIQGLRERRLAISVETYQPAVARLCLEAGANVLNLTGPAKSQEIYRLCANYDAAVIVCYVQGSNVREVGDFQFSGDPTATMYDYFAHEIEIALSNGATKIILDPGLGFYYRNLQDSAIRIRHQIAVFLNAFRLRTLGYPICQALPHAFEHFREEVRSAEAFFAVLAAIGKTDLFRTHEVPRVKAVLDTLGTF